jgi:hypothetical protein
MGDKKKTTQTTGSMPRESSQVGTHGQTGEDWSRGQGSQNKGQGQYRGQGQPMSQDQSGWNKDTGQGGYTSGSDRNDMSQGGWNDRAQRPMQRGDETKPAQPSGTSPLDKDQHPVNQNRPVQQNR